MELAAQVSSSLQSQGLPSPTLSWIRSVLPNRDPMPPLPALTATTKARLMATDITNPGVLDIPITAALPTNITDQKFQEAKLSKDILVQVLDIDNLSKSKWEQVEELEAIARGEQTKGREIIRLANTGEDGEDEAGSGGDYGYSTATSQAVGSMAQNARSGAQAEPGTGGSSKNSTHRLILQDCRGQKVYGLELKRMDKIGVGTTNIGEKILLKKGAIVARGTVLLEPASCVVLGGKVEAWQKAWLEGRLARLRDAIGADARD
ncbi:hypothetical protein BX600DRAFT_435230 [Xylariales sp. PMI_506]|nr:hypothetical protein BX600DRAFT_435230 [Xylariales sp. PMI_506]